jgi:hypothetical protein
MENDKFDKGLFLIFERHPEALSIYGYNYCGYSGSFRLTDLN